MLTKEYINKLIYEDQERFYKLLDPNNNNGSTLQILDSIGKLPKNFNGDCFLPFINHKMDKIRFLAIKNLGKTNDQNYIEVLNNIALNDSSTMVRREAISSIGRMRSEIAIPYLLRRLSDNDPKIVLQAIRALLVFKSKQSVREELKKVKNHPNEIKESVIERQFTPSIKIEFIKMKHPESPDFLKNLTVHGDVIQVLKNIKEESIHLTFTSPPYYNARDYSIYQSYQQYLFFLRDVFKELLRITKEGRFFILNTSPIIIPRVSRQHSSKRYSIPFDIHPFLLDMGWEFIDDIIWVKPEASAKNRNAGFLQHRKPLGYKPNAISEYLMVYRKKTHKLLDWNIRQYDYSIVEESKVKGKYETSNVWCIDPTFDKTHSAVFPIELCSRVIQYYSFKGDLVFDPFGGSGTFGKAALNLERFFFLTEISNEYYIRIQENLKQNSLFQNKFSPRFMEFHDFLKTNGSGNDFDRTSN